MAHLACRRSLKSRQNDAGPRLDNYARYGESPAERSTGARSPNRHHLLRCGVRSEGVSILHRVSAARFLVTGGVHERTVGNIAPERRGSLPKFLHSVCYSSEGIQSVASEGGSARRSAIEAAARSLGGTVESFHFAFGDVDAFTILDLPSNEAAAALGAAVCAGGAARVRTTVLLTPEEVDAALSHEVSYRPPGS